MAGGASLLGGLRHHEGSGARIDLRRSSKLGIVPLIKGYPKQNKKITTGS